MAFTHALATNNFGTAKFIVSSSAANGTHTTITDAIADAVSGETIFIRPGTYTENLTLKAGVNLAAYVCDARSGQVTIVGKCSYSGTGQVTISGIRLQTNSDFALEVTGANVSTVVLDQCQVVNSNNTAISYTSSNAGSSIFLNYCLASVPASNTLFASTSAGIISFYWCLLVGASSSASTSSGAGGVIMDNSFSSIPISVSGAGPFLIVHSTFRTHATNTTCVTNSGTSAGVISNSFFESGSGSAISVGGTLNISNSTISSSNTNAITGAGTISYAGLQFTSSSSTINTTTQSLLSGGPSLVIGSANSGATNTLTLTNTSNTASSAANMAVSVGGGTAADATHQAIVTGVTTWTWGVDNSDSDAFVLAASATLGSSNVMRSTTAGATSFTLGNVDVTKSSSGADVSITASNTSNSASSTATHYATVAGTSAGDAQTQYAVSGTTTWTQGIDNSVTSPTADPWVLAQGTALGTNNVMSVATSGEINYPLQPAFLAVAGTQSNATGDGTSYTMQFTTEIFDQNSDFDGTSTFTAPVTGRYKLQSTCTFTGIGAANTNVNAVGISTSNRLYSSNIGNLTVIKDAAFSVYAATVSTLADMDAADTCVILAQAGGGTKTVGFQATTTTFSGALTA